MTQRAAIVSAIEQLGEGRIGSVRVVEPGVFSAGVFANRDLPALQALAQTSQARNVFDVTVGPFKFHPADGPSRTANYRIAYADAYVDVIRSCKPQPLEDDRVALIDEMADDCQKFANALGFQQNLSVTQEGDETSVIVVYAPGGNGGDPECTDPVLDFDNLLAVARINFSVVATLPMEV